MHLYLFKTTNFFTTLRRKQLIDNRGKTQIEKSDVIAVRKLELNLSRVPSVYILQVEAVVFIVVSDA